MATPTRILTRHLRQPLKNTQFLTVRPFLASPVVKPVQCRANATSATATEPAIPGGSAPVPAPSKLPSLAKEGLRDLPPLDLTDEGNGNGNGNGNGTVDWTRSYHGLSAEPFAKEIAEILMENIKDDDIEVKPDGILYLPEIKYRRILNRAFGPGGWGLAPRGETIVTEKSVTREYALVCHGRLVSIARGEQDYFDPSGIPTATEGCKSNALMRCCKDLGVASELWDPRFIKGYKKKYCVEVFTENLLTKKRRKLWYKKGDTVEFPYRIVQ